MLKLACFSPKVINFFVFFIIFFTSFLHFIAYSGVQCINYIIVLFPYLTYIGTYHCLYYYVVTYVMYVKMIRQYLPSFLPTRQVTFSQIQIKYTKCVGKCKVTAKTYHDLFCTYPRSRSYKKISKYLLQCFLTNKLRRGRGYKGWKMSTKVLV